MNQSKKRSAAGDMGSEEIKMEMTPMIDVTFLLLIFFLCAIKFKVLEGKLQTYLPRDVGIYRGLTDEMLQKVDVRIVRREDRSSRNLENLPTYKQWLSEGGWNESQVEIFVGQERAKSLKDLRVRLDEFRNKQPAPADGEDDDLRMNVEAMKGVIYEDVIRVVDIALEAKFSSITLRGIELDA